MDKNVVLAEIETYIYNLFHLDATGHDYYHMKRVAKMAKYLAEQENGDPFLCEVSGWVHDVGDDKLTDDPEQAIVELKHFLTSISLSDILVDSIMETITTVSFRKGQDPKTLAGKIVQDADRLDAIGAIGIARTFAYGGNKNRSIHSEEAHQKQHATIQHFDDKLLLIKDKIKTDAAKEIAVKRHAYMEQFLSTFYNEWNSNL
ncbi:HD domain-containing protein [Paraliobacillus sediminis]|uniref:HD domain-containing protein n=1 Tax=Paraliobacillus sediminis TaxID=1885916 RepID=UPI000E3D8A50|nr:HD domain-containing protein [Paraliobacillus sediminis]